MEIGYGETSNMPTGAGKIFPTALAIKDQGEALASPKVAFPKVSG